MIDVGEYANEAVALFDSKKYGKAQDIASETMVLVAGDVKEHAFFEGVYKLCRFINDEMPCADVNSNLDTLKTAGCLLEWARLKRMTADAWIEKNAIDEVVNMAVELPAIAKIFEDSGAKNELEKVSEIKMWIFNEIAQRTLNRTIKTSYLDIFRQIGEIVNGHLNDDDFGERLLDVLINYTDSECGALFFIEGPELHPIAGRNIGHETMGDAIRISRSVIRKSAEKAEMICCSDALTDRRFKKSKSILLNQIRSIVCAPLRIGEKVIGAVYLDSRHKHNLYSDEDKRFILTVTHFMSSLIERSRVYKKIEEENALLRSLAIDKTAPGCLVGKSPAICEIRDMMERIAGTDSTVLITGETGSGKGLVARLIHEKSRRKDGKFVAFSCGVVPETLFESELFGHRKGAFTGALGEKKGLFEEADHGTLFLDDISNAPFVVQSKLLQAIEEKTIRRLGEITERRIDARVICATNQDLVKMIVKGQFRDDLYYRISTLVIHVPPLRERTIDIPLLADFFLKKYMLKSKRNFHGFSGKAMDRLLLYHWPGNVRELQHVIESAVCLSQGRQISTDDLRLAGDVRTKKRLFSKEIIENMLKTSDGNVTAASKQLGVTRCTLYRYMKQYNIIPGRG